MFRGLTINFENGKQQRNHVYTRDISDRKWMNKHRSCHFCLPSLKSCLDSGPGCPSLSSRHADHYSV